MDSQLRPIQLQLLAMLSPNPVVEAQVRPRSAPLILTHERHRAALQLLLRGPAPLVQVARAASTLDEQALVDELRELGLDVQTVMVPIPADSSATTDMAKVCYLTKRGTRKVLQHIKKRERKND